MRVLVLGATGMLGHKLLQKLSADFDVVGTVRAETQHPLLRGSRLLSGVEATQFKTVTDALDEIQPEAVINCIGLIKQLDPSRLALLEVNSVFPQRLAEECQGREIRLVNLSTDCVFSGRKGDYTEDDQPDPVDDYGYTKLLGEISGPGCLTLRTSIIGRELKQGLSLVDWFYRQRNGRIKGFVKAIYSGLTTLEMAKVVANVLADHRELEGLWHVSSAPISKYELLSLLNRLADLKVNIEPQDSFVCDRSLNSSRFRRATGYEPPSWESQLEALVNDQY